MSEKLTDAIAELVEVADIEKEELLKIIDSLAIPHEYSDCLGSVVFWNVEIDGSELRTEEDYRHFEELCDSMPHVSPECLRTLGLALFSLGMFYRQFNDGKLTIRYGAQFLTNTATAKGIATEHLPAAINDLFEEFQTKQKAVLSEAGRQEAIAKNLRHEHLKAWALGEAKEMRNAHMDIARNLAARLPAHLADISKDPERLIYDALRNPAKPG